MTIHVFYHFKGLPSYCKYVPLFESFSAKIVLSMSLQLVSTSNGACDPPKSVRTHPGCIDTHKILSLFKSTLMDFVAIFRAALDIRYAYNPPPSFSVKEPKIELIFTIVARSTPNGNSFFNFDAFLRSGKNACGRKEKLFLEIPRSS